MSYNPMSLEGKTILVTGASSGIGRAIAIECSKLGATLIITGRNEERLEETASAMAGENHTAITADISTEEGIGAIIAGTPKLDGVAMVAGIGKSTPASFVKTVDLQRVFATNVFAPMALQAALLKKKKINNNASIIFMASIAGIAGQQGQAIYAASKGALLSYMKVLALELGSKGIRANCILPGMVETPLIHRGTYDDEMLQADMKKYPLSRYGQPEEIAHLAAFLLSDAAAWITGANYVIDGGFTRH